MTVGKALVGMFAVIGVISSAQHLVGQGAAPLAGATVGHIGVIVKDIDRSARRLEEVFGITVPKPMDYGPLRFHTDVPGAAGSLVKVTMAQIGGLGIELIQPVRGPGPHKDHLDAFGEGLQHIAVSGLADNQAAMKNLVARGVGTRTMVNYVYLKEDLGFTVEIGSNRSMQP